jgi:hypothetical protein
MFILVRVNDKIYGKAVCLGTTLLDHKPIRQCPRYFVGDLCAVSP